MNNWILAHGREAEQALADIVPAGARSLALPGAESRFAPPQKLFISEADGGETQWLGRITGVSASSLAFSRPLHSSKDSGARLWRAASVLEFPPESARITRAVITPGVTAEASADGTAYVIQTAPPRTDLILSFEDLSVTGEDELIAWLAVQTRWGLDLFTLVTPEGALSTVQLSGEPVRRECDAKGRRSMSLPLTLLQEGAYQ